MVTSNVVLLVWNCPFMNTPFFTLAYIYSQSELTQSQTTFLVVLYEIAKLDLNSRSKHLKNVSILRVSFQISNFISVQLFIPSKIIFSNGLALMTGGYYCMLLTT